MHGANRLGGNSLAELLVFGKRAGLHAAGTDLGEARIETGLRGEYDIADPEVPVSPGTKTSGRMSSPDGAESPGEVLERAVEAADKRITRLIDRSDGTHHAEIRTRVQDAMGQHVNVFRETDGLISALETIQDARRAYQEVAVTDTSRTFNTNLIHTIETRNVIDIAEAVTVGALIREESRGAHWRAEYRERDDDVWLRHTMLSWNDGDPKLWYRPVDLEGDERTYDPVERSY